MYLKNENDNAIALKISFDKPTPEMVVFFRILTFFMITLLIDLYLRIADFIITRIYTMYRSYIFFKKGYCQIPTSSADV
jgi:hypothetical protein